jgi:hypothetical protein
MKFLGQFWKLWKRFGLFMANIFARIILTIFYFTIILPVGILGRLFSDPLDIKPGKKAQWRKYNMPDATLENLRRPF